MKHVFLVGLRGSGKSCVGRELARLCGREFLDLDRYLIEREKMSVAEIVTKHGWPKFRALEKECLKEASAFLPQGSVIATGGGVVLDRENRERMKKNGHVFWLCASPEVLCRRLEACPDPALRPAFSNNGLLCETRALAQERFPHYLDSAHFIIDGEKGLSEICAGIMELIPEK